MLFGAKKIPELAKGVGKGIKTFKKEMSEDELDVDDENEYREEEKNEYRETIRIGKHYLYLEMYTDVFKALEADGGFRTPPTVWTEDPALYRVAESDTNLVVCVTNLWHLGALTNVANIAARRLGRLDFRQGL